MKSDRFRAAAESKVFSAIDELFSDDVVFRSPVVFKPYEGREAVMGLLSLVAQVFEDFRYVDELEGDGTHALIFRARIGERQVHGLDHLELDGDGRIAVFTVMVRPLSAVAALAEAMGPKVADVAH